MGNYYSILKNQGFDPMSLSPILHINPYKDLYVSTVDNNGVRKQGNLINSATASSGQALATLNTLGSRPVYNGEGWYFKTNSQLTTGAVSDYNFIHNGSDFDISCTVFLCPTSTTTAGRAFMTNNGFSLSGLGFLLRSVKTSGNTTIQFNVGKGGASYISLTSGIIAENATYSIRVVKTGSNVKMFINGTQVATQTIAVAPGVGDAQIMTIGSTLSSTANIYLKDVVILNRVMTAGEVTSMNARTFASITPTDINTYIQDGDSNCAGQGLNSAIAGDLTGIISGAYAMSFNSNTPSHLSYVGKLQTTVNNTLISQNLATTHGSEMRFGKDMGAVKDTFIIKYGVGSTFLYYDWLSTNSNLSYSNSLLAIKEALADLTHVYRRKPVFRGLEWENGANDAYIGGDNISWTRSGTTITITQTNHTVKTNHVVPFTFSSDPLALPTGLYLATFVNANTFTIQALNAGAMMGLASWSAGSTYKTNLNGVLVGIVNYLTSTLQNQVSGATGYTVNKLRIHIGETKSGGSNFKTTSYNDQIAGVRSLATTFLTDNPSMVGKVLEVVTQNNNDVPAVDTVHYTTAGYDTIGLRRKNYYINYINE